MSKFELRLIGSFVFWYWLYIIGAALAVVVLTIILNREISVGAASAIVSAAAAMQPGALYFKRMSDLPSSGFSWRMAVYFFVLQIVFEFLRISIFLFGFNGTIEFLASLLSSWLGLISTLIVYMVQFLMTRYFFGNGAKSEKKRQAKKAVGA